MKITEDRNKIIIYLYVRKAQSISYRQDCLFQLHCLESYMSYSAIIITLYTTFRYFAEAYSNPEFEEKRGGEVD